MMDLSPRDILLQHSRTKLNGVFPEFPTHAASMLNPLCGDQVELKLQIKEELIERVGFLAKACAICTASASILSKEACGWTVQEANLRKQEFEKTLTESPEKNWPETLRAFKSFEHLRINPRRRACAILPWVAFTKAHSGNGILIEGPAPSL